MIGQIIGMVISGIVSLLIARMYYVKASKDLRDETKKLYDLNESLGSLVKTLEANVGYILDDSYVIRKNIVKGTLDDPEYPYK